MSALSARQRTLPANAEPSSLAILAEERERQYQAELRKTAESVMSRLRDLYHIPAIEASLRIAWPMRQSTTAAQGTALCAVYVSLDDSLRAGNCRPSSEQFARVSDRCRWTRADVMRDDRYVRRAVRQRL